MKNEKNKTIKNKTNKKIPQTLTHKAIQKIKEREIVRKKFFPNFSNDSFHMWFICFFAKMSLAQFT